jgi:hypothetical protein
MAEKRLSEYGLRAKLREQENLEFLAGIARASQGIQIKGDDGSSEPISSVDIKFLSLCRLIVHGSITVKIVDGQPLIVERSVERIDLSKEKFLPDP